MNRIAVLTSGGDSPGMNAAVRAVARTCMFNDVECIGVKRGYEGLIDGDFITLDRPTTGGIIHRGGTILRTARSERFKTVEGREAALKKLQEANIDGLVVIGGDGSFHGAKALHDMGFPTMGIPGTIDNDVTGTDETIGFDTAVNTALEAIMRVRDTASSHDRLFIVEVMGRNAGFLALETAVASGAEYAVVPELPLSIGNLCKLLKRSYDEGKNHTLIILAEGVMSATEMRDKLQDTGGYDAHVTVLGYIQRGGHPTSFDVVLATRMGAFATESLLIGKSGMMVGNINHKLVLSDLERAWSEHKSLSPEMLSLINKMN
ncbi:MAG: 6-phosphofructokinase [Synergistaceae bacterium]|nr:6-phosphofructokinase [Synergistaceae bacterium]MBQ3625260.1 6-phosphofructokinase [Synergistaceae bacterium]MBQ6909242.1 6-phosphofructokinase [Synergistaceae bacterium]MBQ9581299.1 6-phosphofructokinase [Synergistaceae bacterium]MBQ9896539.1 6-phosphofructokinase [Synergistaceae bacterium]